MSQEGKKISFSEGGGKIWFSDQNIGPCKETKHICNIVASIAAAIEKDQGVTVHKLAAMHGLPVGTIPLHPNR
jgi:hypothetical protein